MKGKIETVRLILLATAVLFEPRLERIAH